MRGGLTRKSGGRAARGLLQRYMSTRVAGNTNRLAGLCNPIQLDNPRLQGQHTGRGLYAT